MVNSIGSPQGFNIGSFLNVVIHRLPQKQSLVRPPSHCPDCQHRLSAQDLIPVLSYFFLWGRCRYCGDRISLVYPLVEVLTGLLTWLTISRMGLNLEALQTLILIYLLIPVAFIDWLHYLIPNEITLPGIGLGIFFSIFQRPGLDRILLPLLGILAGSGCLLLILLLGRWLFGTPGMGGGDIKLGALIGAFLGWQDTLLSLFIGVGLEAVLGLLLLILQRTHLITISGKNTLHQIPFGPALVAGALLTIFWGEQVLGWFVTL